jgi:hypothetical protein
MGSAVLLVTTSDEGVISFMLVSLGPSGFRLHVNLTHSSSYSLWRSCCWVLGVFRARVFSRMGSSSRCRWPGILSSG